MPRNVTASFRRAAEANFSSEVDLVFLTISHDTFDDDIRVVWDTKDFIYNNAYFIGFPFDITILSDDENPPTARLTIQNVDPRIGDAIRSLTSPPRLKIELLSSVDFQLNQDPRRPTYLNGLTLHFTGADTSTAMEDSSYFDQTVTAHGSAQIDDAQFKFDATSLLLNGTTDYLTVTSDEFVFGTVDFTIHTWVRPQTSVSGSHDIWQTGDFKLYMVAGNLRLWIGGSDVISGGTLMAINNWYHIALTRAGGVFRIFVNGSSQGSYTAEVDCVNGGVTIGSNGGSSEFWNGWMDEFCTVKYSAMWDSNFTPPTEPDPADEFDTTTIYSADRLFLINVSVDIIQVSGTIVGWDYLQRVWPAPRGTQAIFPGLFR